MSLKLYDTASAAVRDFSPVTPGRVGIYQCGATVQAPPHIGHLRPAICIDILRRWLARSGYTVTLIRNVTDIDDKILAKAAVAGEPWWAWAALNERAFTAAYDALGVAPPTYEPRATGHVPEMVAFMDRLIERGHAYPGQPGNVYFSVSSWPRYGELTHQSPDAMEESDDAASDKRAPQDFALWKAPKPTEPADASWDTPWGRGRPGWHLECSAMALRYLGETFDIHAGGLDLRFPHHENEQAQSHAAGYGFARYWMHNGLVTQAGVKMSKSLGNSLLVSALLQSARPVVLRYALTAAHYRSVLEFSEDTLAEAGAAWERIAGFVARAGERVGQPAPDIAGVALVPPAFAAAMDDDLGVATALGVVHDTVRAGNTALAEYDDVAVAQALVDTRAMLDVLGLDPLSSHWSVPDAAASLQHEALDRLVSAELAARQAARQARDFAAADAIRNRLAEAGIIIEDSPQGPRWRVDAPA